MTQSRDKCSCTWCEDNAFGWCRSCISIGVAVAVFASILLLGGYVVTRIFEAIGRAVGALLGLGS